MENQISYIDIHTHHAFENDVISVLNLYDNFQNTPPDNFFSIGLHPWFIKGNNITNLLDIIRKQVSKKNILAVGECGLDKLIDIPFYLQKKIFIEQIKIAEENKKPIIIHCVKAFDDLIRIKKEMKITVPLIIHGFTNNKQILEQLLKNDFYISLGKALIQSNSNASRIISSIPIEKLFLETDDSEVSIKTIFEAAATHLKIDLEKLKQQIYTNFKKNFIHE